MFVVPLWLDCFMDALRGNAVVAQSGPPRQLYEEPASLFVADFIGDANIVPATLSDLNGETARVEIGTIDKRLRHRGAGAGAAKVAIRPESLRLSEARPNGPALEATLAKAAYLGTHMEYTVKTAIGDLFVQGYALDYAALFAKGSRRLPLPTYPFADGRYWVETAASPSMPSRAAVGTRLHPLLHVNASTLAEQRFSRDLLAKRYSDLLTRVAHG